jgi:hypothetical protein
MMTSLVNMVDIGNVSLSKYFAAAMIAAAK